MAIEIKIQSRERKLPPRCYLSCGKFLRFADSRIFVHCKYSAHRHQRSTILPRGLPFFSLDTYVAVLKVGITSANYPFKSFDSTQVLKETCRRFIPVHEADEKVYSDARNLLPHMYTVTGWHSTSNLHGIGKKGEFTTLKKHKA